MKTIEECVPKTIEERALASWNERYPEGSERYRDAQIDGYIAGATEQRTADIKEACECFELAEDWQAWANGDFEYAKEYFRKVLEESLP